MSKTLPFKNGVYTLIALVGVSIALLAGCGGGSDSNQNTAKLATNAKALDLVTTDKLSSISADGAILVFSATTPQIESLRTDDVIVSGITTATPSGLLKKVVSMYTAVDGSVQVTTSPATLTDAFEELHLKGTIASDSGSSVSTSAKAFTKAAAQSESIGIPKITYWIPNTNLGISGEYDATLSGNYTYHPNLEYDIDIGWHIPKKCKFVLRGPATLDMDAVFHATAAVSVKKAIPLSPTPLYIGVVIIPIPIPPFAIVITFDFIPSVGIVLSAEDRLSTNFGFKSSSNIAAGFDYNNGDTALVSSLEDYHFSPYYSADVAGVASAKAYFSPKIGMYLYDSAGVYLDPQPYGMFSSVYSVSSGDHIEAGIGLSGNIGGELKFLSKTLAAINLQIFDLYHTLWASTDTGPPSVPTGLTSTAASTTQIDLSWTASTDDVGVAGYKIYRSGTLIKTVTSTTASDTALTAATSYCYTVSAIDSAGYESAQSFSVCATTLSIPDTSVPSVPTNLSATTVSSTQINLSWSASSDNVGVLGYNIYRNGTYLKSVITTSTSDAGLSPSTQYCYTVSAYDVANNESAQSNPACAVTQTTHTGILQGYVKDAVTQNSLSGVSINIYDSSDNLLSQITTDSSGVYTTTLPAGPYSLMISKTGYISETVSDITIQENVTTTVETVLQVSTAYSGTGTISGTIKNALDGTGVSGVTINFRSGITTTTGNIVTTTTTDSYGDYTVSGLNAGNYTGEAVKSGYTTAYFTATVLGGQTNYNQDATITPILSTGETRIVLTWGSIPSDIDSHLTGPISGSSSRFHVYFRDKGSSTFSPYTELDVDDIMSYGPETTTIYQQFDGVYKYSVHDYTNMDSSSSTALSNSGAQVKVYRGSNLVATFNVPVNQEGTLWSVFELSGDTITPINTMSYESTASSVQRRLYNSSSFRTDEELIRNLPLKW